MVESEFKNFSLVELYNCKRALNLTQFAQVAQELSVTDLVQKYKQLMKNAPRRHEREKKYFVGHELFLGGKKNSNRAEEHLAGALFNECQNGEHFILPDKHKLKLVDYQFPLKSRQNDKGIGKIDLLGVIDDEIPCVIELKVDQKGGVKADTPLRALLEGLAYCAIVEANKKEIWGEAQEKFGFKFKVPRPHLMILGTAKYWTYYFDKSSAGDWWPVMRKLAASFESVGLPFTSFVSVENAEFNYGTGDCPACLTAKPSLLAVAPKI